MSTIVSLHIDDKKLTELASRIKPVVSFENGTPSKSGQKYYIESVDLRRVAYTWDPKPTQLATGLRPLTTISTYHEFGYLGLFKPSIAEVLAQIPAELINKVVAFEIIWHPENMDDLRKQWGAVEQGLHIAKTTLYTK